MKQLTSLLLFLLITTFLFSQSFSEKAAVKACQCLDSMKTYKQFEDSLQKCTVRGIVIAEGEYPEEAKGTHTVEEMYRRHGEVKKILLSTCNNIKRLLIEEKKNKFYKLSDMSIANEHFDKGNKFMDQNDFVNSITEFKTAIRLDKNFVYAVDHLANSYRKRENYKKAIKYYQQSLRIFPEGDYALLNLAAIYSFKEDYENSLKYYNELIFLYPNKPEGYFGKANILFLKEDFEKALDNIFIAHRIYTDTNSELIKDSKQMISVMYTRLKEINKLNLFNDKAKEYNIKINQN